MSTGFFQSKGWLKMNNSGVKRECRNWNKEKLKGYLLITLGDSCWSGDAGDAAVDRYGRKRLNL